LESIASLDYPSDRYELIVVDNGSTDGSFEKIRELLEKKSSLRKKVIKLSRNLGFTGGNNVGFKARDRDSKYIVLLNNDAIPLDHSLKEHVEHAELRSDIGAVQGIIVDLDNRRVDTAGDMVTELLSCIQVYHGRSPSEVKRAFYISYADGAYSLYRVEAVKKATGFTDKIFYDEMFGYFDDSILGLQLWDSGFKIISFPKVTALHRRSSTFGKVSLSKIYLSVKGYYALNELTNSRFKLLIRSTYFLHGLIGEALYLLSAQLTSKFIKKYKVESSTKEIIKAVYLGYLRGVKWGKSKLRERGKPIDLYKAPLIRSSFEVIMPWFLGVGSIFCRGMYTEIATREFKKNIHNYVAD
jgi:GT2 family glycosyltransferase